MSEVIVKVIRVPGTVKEVALNGDRTVRAALDAAEMTVGHNEVVKVNGQEANQDTELSEGARVTLARGAKGNF